MHTAEWIAYLWFYVVMVFVHTHHAWSASEKERSGYQDFLYLVKCNSDKKNPREVVVWYNMRYSEYIGIELATLCASGKIAKLEELYSYAVA